MWAVFRSNPLAVLFAITLHLVIVLVMFFTHEASTDHADEVVTPKNFSIQATIVDVNSITLKKAPTQSMQIGDVGDTPTHPTNATQPREDALSNAKPTDQDQVDNRLFRQEAVVANVSEVGTADLSPKGQKLELTAVIPTTEIATLSPQATALPVSQESLKMWGTPPMEMGTIPPPHSPIAMEAHSQAELQTQMVKEAEVRRQAEVQSQRAAEVQALRISALQAHMAAETEARHKAVLEMQKSAETEARHKAVLEMQKSAEALARHQAMIKAQRLAEMEARQQAAATLQTQSVHKNDPSPQAGISKQQKNESQRSHQNPKQRSVKGHESELRTQQDQQQQSSDTIIKPASKKTRKRRERVTKDKQQDEEVQRQDHRVSEAEANTHTRQENAITVKRQFNDGSGVVSHRQKVSKRREVTNKANSKVVPRRAQKSQAATRIESKYSQMPQVFGGNHKKTNFSDERRQIPTQPKAVKSRSNDDRDLQYPFMTDDRNATTSSQQQVKGLKARDTTKNADATKNDNKADSNGDVSDTPTNPTHDFKTGAGFELSWGDGSATTIQTKTNTSKYNADQRELKSVQRKIYEKVRRNWRIPTNTQKLRCTLRVLISEAGEIVEIVVLKSSGNKMFDTSAERAARHASPLPVPKERRLFDGTLLLVFDPTKS